MTRGGKEIAADEALLVVLAEILIRKYGSDNSLVIPDFREAMVGMPKRFGLWAAIAGDDLVVGVTPQDEEVISLGDLQEAEDAVGKETVH